MREGSFKVERGDTAREGDLCFVMMPLDKKFDGIWAVLEDTIQEMGMKAVRADTIFNPGVIMQQIIDQIAKAEIIVADLLMVS